MLRPFIIATSPGTVAVSAMASRAMSFGTILPSRTYDDAPSPAPPVVD